ncbi:MAG: T9SS type A sorting domain-containing protein, partial [Bacteroidetes bacterium]|nr:T9SS type A sorting domain-containing protein [Bacteroidota bacterium]
LNQNVGFISGSYATILKTTDGGSSWNEVYSVPGNMNELFYDFSFENQTGIAVGYLGNIVRTTDEGDSWTEVESGVTYLLNAVDFCLAGKAIAVGSDENQIVVSYNVGQTWTTETIDPSVSSGFLTDIKFINNTVGFISINGSPQSKMLRTIDAGINWDIVYSGYYTPRAIDNWGDMNIVAGCHREIYESGALFSQNSGLTWTEYPCQGFSWNANVTIVMMDNIMDIIMAGNMGIMYASWGGIWQNLQERTFFGKIYQVQFLDSITGYALAESHQGGMPASDLFRTTDGGSSWNLCGMMSSYKGSFYAVNQDQFFLAHTLLGELLVQRTSDGGLTWNYFGTGFAFEPCCMKFINPDQGLITGEGWVISTNDSGETWQEVIPSGGWIFWYFDIEYISPDTVFVVGESLPNETLISKSFDGGISWIYDIIGNYGPAIDLLISDNNIFIACQNNMILKSTDGGETWYETEIFTTNPIEFNSVSFPSQYTGYAVGKGSYETIVKTMDGGESWHPINSHTTSALNCVHFFDENTGLIFGENGIVLKTTTGGITGFDFNPISLSERSFTAVPNPFTSSVTINFYPDLSKSPVHLSVYDNTGKSVYKNSISTSAGSLKLNTSSFKRGIYFIRVIKGSEVLGTKKVIKL